MIVLLIISDCDHPCFPVLQETTSHDQTVTTGLPTIQQYQTFNEITDESFILNQEIVSEISFYTNMEWSCSENGLLNSAFAMVNLPVMPIEFEFETLEFSGVNHPPVEEWVIGSAYTGSWQIVGTADIPNVGTSQSDINVIQDNRIAGIEAVSIPHPLMVRCEALAIKRKRLTKKINKPL